jgi:hypothetical protein
VTSRLDISAPATITLPGPGLSSLNALPPGGVTISGAISGAVTLTLTAGNPAAAFSASSASGAAIASNANTITITGSQTQVNAALASLTITDPASDTILLTASDPSFLPASTAIALNAAPASAPAFAAPPATISLKPYAISSLAGLVLSDPAATALAAAGLGRSESLAITLSAASGVLLLPSLTPRSGIAATGIGTPQIILTFTADQLTAVNALLAGLAYAAPAAISGLAYAMRRVSGPLAAASTAGNITLNIAGTQGPAATITSGADTVILGDVSLHAGTTLAISGITTNLGGIEGSAAVFLRPGAALQLPYNTLALGGTSLDDGTLGAAALVESGALILAENATFGGPLNLGTGGFIDFAGTLVAESQANGTGLTGISLAAGAVITGNGALVAGNFSESGNITGPGTILVNGGETLLLAAGSISATHLNVAAGGVLVLGPLDPLFGVFDATPLTVDASVTLAFQGSNGAVPITGDYAGTLAQSGGVIVIQSPDIFSGNIVNFAPGDRLVFPGLSGLSLLSVTTSSFVVAGVDSDNVTQSYTFNTAYALGTQPYVSTDAAGDSAVGLRAAATEIFVNGAAAGTQIVAARNGVAQPILGVELLLRSWTTQSLTLTLGVGNGVLADDALGPASLLTLTAASPSALNTALADLVYTGNTGAVSDTLSITSGSGILAGISVTVPIALSAAGGTISGFGNAGQVALFAGSGVAAPVSAAAAPGEILVTGTANFADQLTVGGISGTSLRIDPGGLGIFDAGADVSLGADVTIGGQIGILTGDFFAGGNVTLAGSSQADITGALYVSGSLLAASGTLDLAGNFGAGATTIGAAGTVTASGAARANFGALADAGQLSLNDQANASTSSLALTGTLSLGGTSTLAVQTALASGVLNIGPDAELAATSVTQTGGAIFDSGILSAGAVTLNAAATLAGTIIAQTLVLTSGATLSGAGIIRGTAGLGTLLATGGNIQATGALALGDDISLSNGSTIAIGNAASLDIVHAASGGAINFTGTAAILTINDLAKFTTPVGNMLDQDVIDLIGIAPSLVTFAGGSISAPTGGFALGIATSQPAIQITSDNHGGALISLGGDMPCFARGTRLLTPNGYRPVETFSPGDPVITRDGFRRAVRWIGRRTLDTARAQGGFPVRFAKNSLGPGVPARAVYLSPLHAVYLSGVLVPALHLVNGATITAEDQTAVTYYHIELDRHDVVLAEGMPEETYLDNGNRGPLYHERGTRGTCRTPCAPLVTAGPHLAAIRRRLHNIALQAGFTLTYHPALRGVAAQKSLLPDLATRAGRRLARFTLPARAAALGLAARSATPADTDPESEDRRRLGICLHGIAAGKRTLALEPHLGQGWLARAAGDAGVWMGGAGEILLPPGMAAITLTLAAVIRSWQPPVDLARPGS